MSLRKGDRGRTKISRGKVDLEALQDAFVRNREKPSAKVIRSKPPKIKAGSSLGGCGVDQEAHARASRPTSGTTATGGDGIRNVAERARTASHFGTIPTRSSAFQKVDQASAAASTSSLMETHVNASYPAGPSSGRVPAGGDMTLNAPVVVSGVREREVRAPAPMKIAIGKSGDRHSFRRGREGGCSASVAEEGVSGGFPVVRHRSEMESFKLGGSRAATAISVVDAKRHANGDDLAASRGRSSPGHHHGRQHREDVAAASRRGVRRRDTGVGGGGIPYDIHEENASRVASMSMDEIAEAQHEIRAALSPAAIETLTQRARARGRERAGSCKGGGESGGPFDHQLVGSNSALEHPRRNGLKIGGHIGVGPGGRDWGEKETNAARGEYNAQTSSAGSTNDSVPSTVSSVLVKVSENLTPAEPATGGPTKAQRAATAAGGVDSEEALEAALRLLPPEERSKSAWTQSDGTATQTEDFGGGERREVRVDLDGEVVKTAVATTVERKEALHHHGDDPDKAGYTPSELVRLARSTVSGQRQLALRALAGVLVNRAAHIRRGNAPPHPRLPPMLPIAIRMCLDDVNPKVAFAALRAMEAFLAPLARRREEVEDMIQGLSWLDYQAPPSEVRPLCTPEEEAVLPGIDNTSDAENLSDDGIPGGGEGTRSAVELARMCHEDPCRGMLEMALLPRLCSMVKTYAAVDLVEVDVGGTRHMAGTLHPRDALSCLRILRAVAARASWAAARVARESGLLEGVREAFLEPRVDGSLPFDLSEGPSTSLSTDGDRAPSVTDMASTRRSEDASPERIAVMAVKLTRSLMQSGRDVALYLSATPLLGSTKGLLALGQGLRRPRQGLLLVQREVLELWRCCLSYGIDVSSADTVVLVSRGQGWWPGLDTHPDVVPPGAGTPPTVETLGSTYNEALCSRNLAAKTKGVVGDGGGDAKGEINATDRSRCGGTALGFDCERLRRRDGGGGAAAIITPRLSFLRAMHQLACACVISPRDKSAKTDSGANVDAEHSRGPAGGRDEEGKTNKRDLVPYILGGISVDPETWANVGDTVDASVEASLRHLLSGDRIRVKSERVAVAADVRERREEETVEMALQSAAIHLVACWLERYRVMSRMARASARGIQRLETTAEDAALLFSLLLDSSCLPAAVEIATRSCLAKTMAARAEESSSGDVADGEVSPPVAAFHHEETDGDWAGEVGVAAAAVAALDWLSGVFRLGLACERWAPGEAEAALAACSDSTASALANLLAASPPQYIYGGARSRRGRGAINRPGDGTEGVVAWRRSLRRASATARWLGCRLLAFVKEANGGEETTTLVEGDQGRPSWEALRRDCALNAVALCEPGDEAVAVGLIAEGLRDHPLGGRRTNENIISAASCTTAPALLRKLFRGAVSDPAAFAHASFHLDGRWSSLQSLEASAGTASLLPLPRHWLFLPLASQGGERAASVAVSACLSVLVQLEREGSVYVRRAAGVEGAASASTNHPAVVVADWGGEGVAPEVKLYHLMNASMYGAAVFSDGGDRAEADFEWLLGRYLDQCGRGFEARLVNVVAQLSIPSAPDPAKIIADAAADAATTAASSSRSGGERGSTGREQARAARAQSHAERALLEFVKDLVGSFLADSFGLSSFARVLRVFVRTGFPVAARCIIWNELGTVGLLPLLDTAPWPPLLEKCDRTRHSFGTGSVEGNGAWTTTGGGGGGGSRDESDIRSDSWIDAYLYPLDADPIILDAYMAALEHPRFDTGRKEDHGGEAWGFASNSRGSESEATINHNVSGGTSAAKNRPPVHLARAEKETMHTVAVHHLACYLFPRSLHRFFSGNVEAAGENDERREEDAVTKQPPLVWRPDFGRRKIMERLLLLAGREGRGAITDSTLVSVLGYECMDTKSSDDAGILNCCDEGSAISRDDGSRNDPRDRWQLAEVERAQTKRGGGATETNIETVAVISSVASSALPTLSLARDDAGDPCRRRQCLRVASLGRYKRELLRVYFGDDDSAGVSTGAVDNEGDESEKEQTLGEWLMAEDRNVEDIIRRLLSRST